MSSSGWIESWGKDVWRTGHTMDEGSRKSGVVLTLYLQPSVSRRRTSPQKRHQRSATSPAIVPWPVALAKLADHAWIFDIHQYSPFCACYSVTAPWPAPCIVLLPVPPISSWLERAACLIANILLRVSGAQQMSPK
jgi:hypothetical protein